MGVPTCRSSWSCRREQEEQAEKARLESERAARAQQVARARSTPRIRMPGEASVEPLIQRVTLRQQAEEEDRQHHIQTARGAGHAGGEEQEAPAPPPKTRSSFFKGRPGSPEATSSGSGMDGSTGSPVQGLIAGLTPGRGASPGSVTKKARVRGALATGPESWPDVVPPLLTRSAIRHPSRLAGGWRQRRGPC